MHKNWQKLRKYAAVILFYPYSYHKHLEEREMEMLDRVQKAVATYQEQLDAEAKDRQKRTILEMEERKRLEFEYA